jgi:hypothetical protein
MPKFSSISTNGDSGLFATSAAGIGIHAESHSTNLGEQGAAVAAYQKRTGATGNAVYAETVGDGDAIAGIQKNPTSKRHAVYAETVGDGAAIVGIQLNPHTQSSGIYAEHRGNLTAAFFKGNVIVTGDMSFPGQDCAEHFTVDEGVIAGPGTVMALNGSGVLVPTAQPYEKKVVGVVAGAGEFKSGIVLGKLEHEDARRLPIALMGKVYCKADASYGAIEVGDLLTSSGTNGHAMRASDPLRAFGSVIGKAMAPLAEGLGLIPILIALQ